MLRNSGFTAEGDDEVYRTSIETWGSWYNWAKAYYNGNSGRVLIHTLLICFLNMPVIIWRIASAGMIAATCCMMYRYSKVNTVSANKFVEGLLALMSCALFFAIPSSILANSVRWASGSLNYLFPVCALLICLFPFWKVFREEHLTIRQKWLSFLFLPLCANMEQSSAVLSAMGLLCFSHFYFRKNKTYIKKYRRDCIFLAVIWCSNILIAVIGYLAPGNSSRYTVELLRFAGYNMYTMVEKLILGIQLFILYFYSFRGLMTWLIPSGIIALVYIRRHDYKGAILPGINVILSCVQNILIRKVFDLEFLHPFDLCYLIWLASSILLLFYNGHIILQCTKDEYVRYWLLYMYYGLIAAGVIVCLSPTLYVSAGRTMYISYIMLILIIILMIRFSLSDTVEVGRNCNVWIKVNAVFGTVVSVVIALLFVMGTHQVEKLDLSEYKLNTELSVQNVVMDFENSTISATISVLPFAYTADNWCTGQIDGYNINISIGIMNISNGTINSYRTYLHPEYPVMSQYPDEMVEFTGFYKQNYILSPEEVFVITYTDHENNKWYMPLEIV